MEMNQNQIKIEQECFVAELKDILTFPNRTRDSRLRELGTKYRETLGDCTDNIPCDLERFGFPHGTTMSFDRFIYNIIGRT